MYLGLVSHMFTVHVHICASVCRISRWPHRQRHGTQRVPLIPWAVRFAGQPRRGDVEDDLVERRSTPNPRVEDPLFGAASCSYSASLPWVVAGTTQMPVTQTSIFWKAFFASFPHKCVFSKRHTVVSFHTRITSNFAIMGRSNDHKPHVLCSRTSWRRCK